MTQGGFHVTTIENAAHWMVDNRYIYHGYRSNIRSFRESLRSLFSRHNELMNILTHLIGALVFIVCFGFLFSHFSETKLLYQEAKQKFAGSEFVRSIYAHSHTVKDYFAGLGIDSDFNALQQRLAELRANYTLRYEALKTDLIQRESMLLSELNRKLEHTAQAVERTFNIWVERLHNFTSKADRRLTEFNERLDHLLNIDSLVVYLESVFHSPVDYFPVLVYTLCAVACLGLSAIFHSFYIINPRICKILQKCDYAGIVILIFGSCFAFFHYAFYCQSFWRTFYNLLIGFFSVVTFLCSLSDYFDTEEGATLKGVLMGGLGLSNLLPGFHMAVLSLNPSANRDMLDFHMFFGLLRTGFFYLSGLAIYILRFPEKKYPKKFDIWLNSHTIWHIFVFFGALSHYFAILRVYEGRVDLGCPL